MIDPPTPFATLAVLADHLMRLYTLPDHTELKLEMIESARRMIAMKLRETRRGMD